MRKVITILLWRDVFSSFQERGKEEFRVHKELNLRHSDLFSDEPQRLYREKVLGSYPPVDSDCFLCLTFLDKTENTIIF